MPLSAAQISDDDYREVTPKRSLKYPVIFKFFLFFFLISEYISLVSSASLLHPTPLPAEPSFSKSSSNVFLNGETQVKARFIAKRTAKLLAFPSILFDSHLYSFKRLAQGLRTYGHQLTLYLSDRRKVEDLPEFSVRRYPGIFSTDEANAFLQTRISNILAGKPIIFELFNLLGRYAQNCDQIFIHGRDSIEALRNEKYDLIIVDPNELCGILLAKKLGVPHIIFSTGIWVPFESNSPSPLSYVPEFNSLLTTDMNFFQRVYNNLFHGFSRMVTSYLIFPMYNRLIFKHHIGYINGHATEYIKDMVYRTQSWLLSTDIALEFPLAIMPYTEFVGGISAHPADSLPHEFQVFADTSSNFGGFIVVSFGTGVQRLNPKLENIFSTVLSSLPVHVLWKYPHALVNVSSNVKLVDWLPQNDLLAHSNLLLFIGHGGGNGIFECIYHAVPIIGMPLFGDQYDSMIRVQAKGAGILLDWKRLTTNKLQAAIEEVLHNPKYKQAAELLSQIHRDQPLPALDRACRRIDYIIRYDGAKHLIPTVTNINPFKYYSLDVYLFLLVAFALILWGIYGSVVTVIRKLLLVTKDKTHNKNNYQTLNRGGDEANAPEVNKVCFSCHLPFIALVKSASNIVLSVCSRLRVFAVHPFYCGRCICGSRTFLACLNKISRGILKLGFTSKKSKCVYPVSKFTVEPKLKSIKCQVKEDEGVLDTVVSSSGKNEQPFIPLMLQEDRETQRNNSPLAPSALLVGMKPKNAADWVGLDGFSSTPSNMSDSGSFLELTSNVLTTDCRRSEAQYRLTQCNPSTRRSVPYQDCRSSHLHSYFL